MAHWTEVALTPEVKIYLRAEGDALVEARFSAGWEPAERKDRAPVLREAARELKDYMAGKRRVFGVPFELDGTEFQCRVWAELCKIPFGELSTYGEIAKALGTPGAVRAVGAANGRNPLAVFVPCHRVIGKDGTLTGYSGGLEVKRLLLAREGILL
jgi:methylated-DNA-[protein]-cysteine S-methyltransferase